MTITKAIKKPCEAVSNAAKTLAFKNGRQAGAFGLLATFNGVVAAADAADIAVLPLTVGPAVLYTAFVVLNTIAAGANASVSHASAEAAREKRQATPQP